jgi:hypothetical protein
MFMSQWVSLQQQTVFPDYVFSSSIRSFLIKRTSARGTSVLKGEIVFSFFILHMFFFPLQVSCVFIYSYFSPREILDYVASLFLYDKAGNTDLPPV